MCSFLIRSMFVFSNLQITELFAHKKAAYCDLESELVRNKELVKAPEFD